MKPESLFALLLPLIVVLILVGTWLSTADRIGPAGILNPF